MKIPGEEFWFKMGLCQGAIYRLKEIHEADKYNDEMLIEEKKIIVGLWETILEISETVYKEEDD